MVANEEIVRIKKQLEEHEERIQILENLVKAKGKGVITKKKSQKKSITDHLTSLKLEGFFDQPKTTKEILEKLAQEGYHYPTKSLSDPLRRAIRGGLLGRIKKNKLWAYCKR